MFQSARLVIGTRGSPLAVAQAAEVQGALASVHGWPEAELPLRPMTTTGDAIQDRPLADAGGKGLFTKELDIALVEGSIDLAVHSAKDLPTLMPDGIVIAGYLPREDVRDALITSLATSLSGLPPGTVVGTAALRRQAIILHARPDLRVALLRGNVGTRLAKLGRGEVGATLLALAGLKRLGLERHAAAILSEDEMLPAVGQGAIAITMRAGDDRVGEALSRITHGPTNDALAAERAYLAVLDGSCRTPIAGHARIGAGRLSFRGLIARPDGTGMTEVSAEGRVGDAARIGREAGLDLKARRPAGFPA